MFCFKKIRLLIMLPCIITGYYSYAVQPVATTASELIERNRELSRLSKELAKKQHQYSALPRHHYIDTGTKANQGYMQQWVAKVERVAKLNYPKVARGLQQPVSARVDVALHPDGSVHQIRIVSSSGDKEIDNSINTLIKLAAPFAAFPDAIKRDTDILHIVRKWTFVPQPNTAEQ